MRLVRSTTVLLLVFCGSSNAVLYASFSRSASDCSKNVTAYRDQVGEGWDGYSWVVSGRGTRAGWTAHSRVHGTALGVKYTPPGANAQHGAHADLETEIRLCKTGQLIDTGAHRFAALARQQHTVLARSADPCNEEAEFRRGCRKVASTYQSHLLDTEFKRGLFFEASGANEWGFGNLLSLVYLIHQWCLEAQRFCYIRYRVYIVPPR